ncbi:MAG: hypothetical protein Tsb0013_09040 [Phycisphaerales bacterium]
MTVAMRHLGVSLVETLSVIVVIAAIAPVLAQLLSSTNAAHADAQTMRVGSVDARYAVEAAEARVRTRLDDASVTLTHASHDALSFSDGSSLRLVDTDLIWVDGILPDGVLAMDVHTFSIDYFDASGAPVDPTGEGFDQSDVERVAIELSVGGHTLHANTYREAARRYTPSGSHDRIWFERFDDLTDGTTDDIGDTAWSTYLDGHTYASHGVLSGKYAFSHMAPRGRFVTWRSEEIDIAEMDEALLEVSLDGAGTLDSRGRVRDTLEIGLSVDGVRTVVYTGNGTEPVGMLFRSAPFTGETAVVDVRALVTGGDERYTIDDVRVGPSFPPDMVIFEQDAVLAHSPGAQDGQGGFPTLATVSDHGRTIRIEGNAWKAIPFAYTVTQNTVIAFEFRTDALGEIHTICFDNNLVYNGFELRDGPTPAGTQTSHGLRSPHVEPYDLSGDWTAYEVRLWQAAGDSVLGDWSYLVLLADDDRFGACVSEFRNVRVFEEAAP